MIWNATNSSMDSDGIITMTGAKMTGGYIQQENDYGCTFKIQNGKIAEYYGSGLLGSIELNANSLREAYFKTDVENVFMNADNNIDLDATGNTFVQGDNINIYADTRIAFGPRGISSPAPDVAISADELALNVSSIKVNGSTGYTGTFNIGGYTLVFEKGILV